MISFFAMNSNRHIVKPTVIEILKHSISINQSFAIKKVSMIIVNVEIKLMMIEKVHDIVKII